MVRQASARRWLSGCQKRSGVRRRRGFRYSSPTISLRRARTRMRFRCSVISRRLLRPANADFALRQWVRRGDGDLDVAAEEGKEAQQTIGRKAIQTALEEGGYLRLADA